MHTMKLFAYQRPSCITALLDSLVQSRAQLSATVFKVTRVRGCPALRVGTHEMTGQLKGWQLWACLKDGMWQQCAL